MIWRVTVSQVYGTYRIMFIALIRRVVSGDLEWPWRSFAVSHVTIRGVYPQQPWRNPPLPPPATPSPSSRPFPFPPSPPFPPPLPFLRSRTPWIQLGSRGALWAPPAGSGAEVEFGAFYTVTTILIIFLRINWPNLLQSPHKISMTQRASSPLGWTPLVAIIAR